MTGAATPDRLAILKVVRQLKKDEQKDVPGVDPRDRVLTELSDMPGWELVEKFDLMSVGSSPSVFDTEKLGWVNAQHMLKRSDDEIASLARPFIEDLGLEVGDMSYAARALASEREKARTLKELAELSAFYFRGDIQIDEKAGSKWLTGDGRARLSTMREKLSSTDDWSEEGLAGLFEAALKELDCKMLKVAQPLRVALTGSTASPGIYEVLSILGKDKSLKRIDAALAKYPQ